MEPGQELDAKMAELVGWEIEWWDDCLQVFKGNRRYNRWSPSTGDWGAVGEIICHMVDIGMWSIGVNPSAGMLLYIKGETAPNAVWCSMSADKAPYHICLAALAAKSVEV